MKTSEIVSSVRSLLDDEEFDKDKIIEAANWLQDSIFNNHRTRIMEASVTDIEAAINDVTFPLPDDLQTIITTYVTSPRIINLESRFLQYESFMPVFANFASATATPINKWTLFGNAVRFSAPLSEVTLFSLDYLRKPVAMKRDNDVCEIPDNYKEIISRGSLARLMERNEDYDEADVEYARIEPLITTFVRNEGRGQGKTGPVVMRSNRRKNNDW